MARQPVLPRNDSNPVQTGRQRGAAFSEIKRALRNIQRGVLEQFEQIQYREVTGNASAESVTYEYLLDANVLDNMNRILADMIDEYVMRAQNGEPIVIGQVDLSYQTATATAVTNIAVQSEDFRRTVEETLLSQSYRTRIALVRARVFEEMRGFTDATRTDLSRVLADGMGRGQSPRDIARTIRDRIGVAQSRAERIARTEINNAHRQAIRDEDAQANAEGIQTRLLWVSALKPTTRVSHAALHGKTMTRQEVNDFYSRDGNPINCYLPGTKVSGRFVAGSKAGYKGDVVMLVTRSGNNLTITPNHPVMTDGGLVAAAKIRKGDNLVCDKVKIESPSRVSDLNGELADAAIEDVFGSLMDIGHSISAGVGAIDFHGDGEFIKEDVDVVISHRELVYGGNSTSFKRLDDLALISSHSKIDEPIGSGNLRFHRVDLSAPCLMGGSYPVHPFLGSGSGSAELGRLATIAPFEPSLGEPSIDGYSRDAEGIRKFKNAFTLDMTAMDFMYINAGSVSDGLMASVLEPLKDGAISNSDVLGNGFGTLATDFTLDEVVDISVFHYEGPVYDLEELSGLMIANGLISSNCKCTQVSCLTDDEGKPLYGGLINRLQKQGKEHFND